MNLYEGSTLQGVAGARRVGRPLRGGKLGVRTLDGPFVSGRVLERRREDRRVRVEHSVRQVVSLKKKIFLANHGISRLGKNM